MPEIKESHVNNAMIFKDELLIWSCPPATGVEITPLEFELPVSDKQKLSHPNALVPACCHDTTNLIIERLHSVNLPLVLIRFAYHLL